jgi:hypothetical protein
MLTSKEILRLLTEILSDDFDSKSRIRNDYEKFKPKMSDSDAKLLSSVKYLKSLISERNSHRP